jgi:phage tail protein X
MDYVAQTGDTLEAVAVHFNTSIEMIRSANPEIPEDTTTLPEGLRLQVPAFYLPLTASAFKILPDSEVVNGPSAVSFHLREELAGYPGYVSGLTDYAFSTMREAWDVIGVVSRNYSIHPRLLLALLEHQTGALSRPTVDEATITYPLDYPNVRYRGLYRQLIWAAERLNDGYYGWRTGTLREFELADGLLARPDPWLNAGTVAIQYLFAGMYGMQQFTEAVGPEGFYATYRGLFGDPFELAVAHIPGNLQQPELTLPFVPNRVWVYSGGPHFAWGTSLPLGALDFAPPAAVGGCAPSTEWAAAPAAGVITRSESATVVLDLDEDRDDRTGWSLFFFHIAEEGRIPLGSEVEVGDLLGHPSCEGGQATGTHFHLARKYNGEWTPAGGAVPFMMDGWVAEYGDEPYLGTLTKGSKTLEACTCSTSANRILYELPK